MIFGETLSMKKFKTIIQLMIHGGITNKKDHKVNANKNGILKLKIKMICGVKPSKTLNRPNIPKNLIKEIQEKISILFTYSIRD